MISFQHIRVKSAEIMKGDNMLVINVIFKIKNGSREDFLKIVREEGIDVASRKKTFSSWSSGRNRMLTASTERSLIMQGLMRSKKSLVWRQT